MAEKQTHISESSAENSGYSLSRLDIILGLICAIFFIDTVAPIAAMGVSAISWMVIIGVVFFFPGCLVVAEQGAAYPENGGLYAWIKRAYGTLWGARIAWMYWCGNALWISSAMTVIVNVFCQLFAIEIGLVGKAALNIILVWAITALALRPMRNSTFIINFASSVKILMALGLILSGVIWLYRGHAPANTFSWEVIRPTYGQAMIFIPALIYNFLGFETMSAAAASMRNPKKDIPIASLSNVILVIGLNIIAVSGVLLIIPSDKVDIIGGIISCFRLGFGDGIIGTLIVYIIGLLYLAALCSQSLMWMLATCRMAQATAQAHELPAALAKSHPRHDSPAGALIAGAVITTIMTIVSTALSGSAEEMFWSIFSSTTILLLIPYFVNFQAFLKLRKYDTTTHRPYIFPAPNWVVTALMRLAQIILFLTAFFLIWVPGQPFKAANAGFIAIGVMLTLGVGEFFIRRSLKQAQTPSPSLPLPSPVNNKD
ncbi:TPA: APC family permease [Kluyvera ascorbata]|uniref:APC family permease n=1 Tax=Kluyvera sp. Awk 3 TaxID=2963956 RepID=UPI002302A203|nr:APC family permease [Kluyvera sp. Awk 3]HDT6543583.1 APC family permease [Kluyvera ascorbata]